MSRKVRNIGNARNSRHVLGRSLGALRRTWQNRIGACVRCRGHDRGMTTSEYAVGTIAACAFAAVLYKVVTSGAVLSALQSLIKGALDAKF
ncbi:DUF4244 domain-containing protein [Streptomyces sp. NBC_01012]|uniref:DUF4244 domain-containing protein n=1 Tax=Streptomyces sp. NBC_01012 TaxID=2903717 RepID=UPI0038648A1D|nr:DUF4244 domain-containing protein [Streptomyces sp. NBC_01012]